MARGSGGRRGELRRGRRPARRDRHPAHSRGASPRRRPRACGSRSTRLVARAGISYASTRPKPQERRGTRIRERLGRWRCGLRAACDEPQAWGTAPSPAKACTIVKRGFAAERRRAVPRRPRRRFPRSGGAVRLRRIDDVDGEEVGRFRREEPRARGAARRLLASSADPGSISNRPSPRCAETPRRAGRFQHVSPARRVRVFASSSPTPAPSARISHGPLRGSRTGGRSMSRQARRDEVLVASSFATLEPPRRQPPRPRGRSVRRGRPRRGHP